MAKKALGRGMGALMGRLNGDEQNVEEMVTRIEERSGCSSLEELPLDLIDPNEDQPRRDFNSDKMQELVASIRELGVIQAITVRPVGDRYQIISGERRYRASKLAGLTSIPAYIKDITEHGMMEMALVENIQREDLNPIEVSLAYQDLMTRYDMTQEEVAKRVGKSRSAVANYLRILRLPDNIKLGLKEKKIDMSHAKSLASLANDLDVIKVYNAILKDDLSVRAVEQMVKKIQDGETADNSIDSVKVKPQLSEEYELMRTKLRHMFSAKANLTRSPNGSGKVTIPFANDDEMERIFELFDKIKNDESEA